MFEKKVIIIGTGSQAKLICDGILKKKIKIEAFYDTLSNEKNLYLNKKKYPILKKIDDLKKYINKNFFICSVGTNFLRAKIINKLEKTYPSIKWYTYISKTAKISKTVIIEKGCMIMDGVMINALSKIGKHSIINTGSIIEHDNCFESYSSTGPGVITGGNVFVGHRSHVGMGCVVKNNIIIRNDVVVGIGSIITKNCYSGKIYLGIPAKKIKKRKFNENYL